MTGRICITIKGTDCSLDSEMDEHFGRAEGFLIIDEESDELTEFIKNPSVNEAHGAGLMASSIMYEKGVEAIISGRFGPKAYQALSAYKIDLWAAPPNINAKDAYEMLGEGKLEKVELRVIR